MYFWSCSTKSGSPGLLIGTHQARHLHALRVTEHDETVDEVRPGLERQRGLIWLKHEREVYAVAVFLEHQRQIVAPEEIRRRALVVAL